MTTEIGSLARALLEATGETRPAGARTAAMGAFDWKAHGVTQPYLIFMTGRCGSTWLTSLIKNTRLAGNPDEFFNGDVARHAFEPPESGLQSYFSHVVRKEASNGRFGVEIDGVRLNELERLIDWTALFPPEGAKTFFLYRRDILAQAWSWLSARKTGVWHVWKGKEAKGTGKGQPVETGDLAREIVRIRRSEEYLERFFGASGYSPYYLDYESLASDPTTQLAVILRILGIDDERLVGLEIDKQMLSKISYSDRHHRLAEFSERHQDVLTALHKNRLGLGSAEIARMLAVA